MNESIEMSRRFYDEQVAPLIHNEFSEYESHIAVGIAGEGSDCFGYDDLGMFSSFRKKLLEYYPEKIWKVRLADEFVLWGI